jgi:hypothetical protein
MLQIAGVLRYILLGIMITLVLGENLNANPESVSGQYCSLFILS